MADDIFALPLTAAAAELLAEAAHTMSRRHASTVFKRFLATASLSKEEFEAAFLAGQMLRDLAILNRLEAAYAFQSLIAVARAEWLGADGSVPAFYRARGEHVTAEVVEQDLPRSERFAERGRRSLIYRKPNVGVAGVRSTEGAAAIAKRVHDVNAGVGRPNLAKEWKGTMQALKDVSVLVAVRTVRSLRESNALSVTHATRFIDTAIGDTVELLCDRDAELREHWDAVRARKIKVVCLRRLGEHELAKLLLRDPDAYAARLRHHWPPRGAQLPIELELEVAAALQLMEAGRRGEAQQANANGVK
jgi:hypothetical protein